MVAPTGFDTFCTASGSRRRVPTGGVTRGLSLREGYGMAQ